MSKKSNDRESLHVSKEFKERIEKLQGLIQAKGLGKVSLTDVTDNIVKVPAFEEVEKQILEKSRVNEIKIRMDKKIF